MSTRRLGNRPRSMELNNSADDLSTPADRRGSTFAESESHVVAATFDSAHPQASYRPVRASFGKIYRQLLGLNPFKGTYLSLYDPLDSVGEKLIAAGGALFAIAAGVPLPLIGYIFGKIINEFPPPENVLQQRLVQLIGVAIAFFGVTAIYTIAFGLTAENVSVKLRKKLLDCLLHLDQAYLDTHDIDVNGLLTEKMDTIQAGCSEKVGIFLQAMSYFVASFVVGFILDAKLTGILLASVVPAITLSFALLSPAVSKFNRAGSSKVGEANGIVEGALSAVKIVQAFDMIGEICRRQSTCLDQATGFNVKKALAAAMQSGSVYFIAYAANALAFYVGSRISSNGNAGTVYAVVFLILDASFVVGQFAPFVEVFARAASAKAIIQELLDVRKDNECSATYRHTDCTPDLSAKDITFVDVGFQYPARPAVSVLNGLNLTLKSGKFTAIVGTSGGGKSTLVALLSGIYNYHGRINIGDDDVRSIDSGALRSQIAVLDQETVLLSGSIRDNVCYGLIGQDISEAEKSERCDQALKDANVDFLSQLNNGVHTRLGNETELSGGQRQRVCLARALIKKPAVLVLDEPTSALDARSEVAVMDAVKNVIGSGTTVLMVAHRLSTTLDADHIAVVSDGKVVEEGTPAELSKPGTVFQGLLDAQNTNFSARDSSADGADDLAISQTRSTEPLSNAVAQSDELAETTTNVRPALPLGQLAKRIGFLAKPDWQIAAIGIAASVVSGGLLLGQAIVFSSLIELLNGGRSSSSYYQRADFFCLMFFVMSLIALGSYGMSGTAFGIITTRLTCRVQTTLLRKLLHLDLPWFSQPGHSTHGLMASFTKDPGDLSALGGVALGAIFTILTSVVGGIILSLCVAWKIAVVLLAAVPVMLVAGYARLRLLTASENKHREAYSEATSLAAEACRKRRAVTSLCLESHLLFQYQQALHLPFRQIRRFVFLANTLLAFCFSVTYFVYALAYWWGSQQVRNGSYTVRDFFVVLPALLFSSQSAGHFFSLSPEIARAKTAARNIFRLLDAHASIMPFESSNLPLSTSSTTSSVDKKDMQGALASDDQQPTLEFNNVTLLYPNTSKPALKRVNLTIYHGQTVAFVGPSGAGKSTAMALIERFYDATEGAILQDGVDVREMNVRLLRSSIGLVSQEPDLFPGSISYNVKLGAAPGSTVTDAEVEAACIKCGLHDFITSLPDGYSTECGASGSSQLSGGQQQRLALARALVRNPQILLLDEPTSALDAHSETHVQAALAEAAKGRTTVMVAHRLASIQHVDKIFVFDRGKVVEQGTHAELVEQGGLYASMAKAQSLV